MKKYFLIFKLSVQDLLEYRFDFLTHVFKYALAVLLASFVWRAVSESTQSQFLPKDVSAYFFFSAIIYGLVNFHLDYVEEDIKMGGISKFLLKPFSAFWNYFFIQLARVITETIVKSLAFLPILWWWQIMPPFSMIHILLVTIYLPIVFFFSFNFLYVIGLLTFWIEESFALRWSSLILVRFFSGLLVPILFFPEAWQKYIFFLPFPHLAYTPIMLMIGKINSWEVLKGLMILCVWTLVIVIIREFVWACGTKKYESIGQ